MDLKKFTDKLENLDFESMYQNDFLLTWERSPEELEAVFTVADALRELRENNVSPKIFDSGLGVSLFRDNSTRTRFSFASACNMLGLEVQDLDEGKSQIAHGETVRETANMISDMLAEVGISIRAHEQDGALADGSFLPESGIKRSEVAAIIVRMFDSAERKSFSLG